MSSAARLYRKDRFPSGEIAGHAGTRPNGVPSALGRVTLRCLLPQPARPRRHRPHRTDRPDRTRNSTVGERSWCGRTDRGRTDRSDPTLRCATGPGTMTGPSGPAGQPAPDPYQTGVARHPTLVRWCRTRDAAPHRVGATRCVARPRRLARASYGTHRQATIGTAHRTTGDAVVCRPFQAGGSDTA